MNKQVLNVLDELNAMSERIGQLANELIPVAELWIRDQNPEVNEDGDSIEDMKAVADSLGANAIQIYYDAIVKWRLPWGEHVPEFTAKAKFYRIAAKHSDVFDPKCMDFKTWARATIRKGFVCEAAFHGETHYGIRMLGNCLYFDTPWDGTFFTTGPASATWIAIPKKQYVPRLEPQPEPTVIANVLTDNPSGDQKWMPMAAFAKAVAEEMQKA